MKYKNMIQEAFLKFKLPVWFLIVVLATFAISAYTRAEGIGYSNFQGDEINTVDFIYEMKGNDVLEYLFSQKRGPVQYIINIVNVSVFGYHNEFWIRLPYLFLGILAIFTFYKFSKEIFGKNAALLSVVLISINGLFIAFSRITQYQALMYCVIPVFASYFIYALSKMSHKHILFSGLSMSLMLITHYDTLSVAPFFIVMFVGKFIRENKFTREVFAKYLKLATIFFLAFVLPALAYYIPFTFGSEFESRTSGYLEDRLLGGGLMPRTKITIYLISMYIPSVVIAGHYFLAIISGLFHAKDIREVAVGFVSEKLVKLAYISLIFLNMFGSVLSLFYLKPRLSSVIVITTSIGISLILLISKKISYKYAAIMTWFLGAYSAYFYLMKDPRTHVYVVFIPGMVLAGYALYKIYTLLLNRSHIFSTLFLGIFSIYIIYIIGFNWMVFVDRAPEYPWFDKYYFGKKIFEVPKVRHKKIDGVFGFNNWRGWTEVSDLFNQKCLMGTFDSNEKNSITYFYFRQNQLRGEKAGFVPGSADNLIVVEGPHSWEYQNVRIYLGYTLVKVIKSNDIPVTYIYSKNYNRECFPEVL